MVLGNLHRYERWHGQLLAGDPAGRIELLLARGASERIGDPGRHANDDAGAGGDDAKLPPAFGRNGIIQGLPSNKVCLSKRHFTIHIRRYRGITYVEAIVFVNRRTVAVVKTRSSQFSAPIDLRGLPAGTFPVKITVITTTGSIITGTRTYKTCHRKVGFHGRGRL